MTTFDKNKLQITSVKSIPEEKIYEFFERVFPERVPGINKIWKWLNRVGYYDNETPYAIIYENKVVSFAGLIPFDVLFDKKKYRAAWYIDFATLPEFQKKGLGTLITKKWMEYADISLEITHNEFSGPILKKLGWTELFDSYQHFIMINPLFHQKFAKIPYFIRFIFNSFVKRYYTFFYYKNRIKKLNLEYKKHNSEKPLTLCELLKNSDDNVFPVRDFDYFEWRIYKSPDNDKYLLVVSEKFKIILKECNTKRVNYLDILYTEGLEDDNQLASIIANIACDYSKGRYAYIRFYTNKKQTSLTISKKLKTYLKQLGFMYYTADKELRKKLLNAGWNWQLIDNDFEKFEE